MSLHPWAVVRRLLTETRDRCYLYVNDAASSDNILNRYPRQKWYLPLRGSTVGMVDTRLNITAE